MRRQEGWERRFTALLRDAETRPFVYGDWDCCLFGATMVLRLTGEDLAAAYRGRYQSEAEATALLASEGGVAALIGRLLAERGYRPIVPSQAKRGDVVLATLAGRDTVGICCGPRVAFARQPAGLEYVPITSPQLTRAWEIG